MPWTKTDLPSSADYHKERLIQQHRYTISKDGLCPRCKSYNVKDAILKSKFDNDLCNFIYDLLTREHFDKSKNCSNCLWDWDYNPGDEIPPELLEIITELL
jgi:hypothetical protein